MSRFLTILLASLLLLMPVDSASQQKRKNSSRPKTETPAKKTSTTKKKSSTGKSTSKQGTARKKTTSKGKAADSNRSEKEVRRDKSRAETDIKETRRQIQLNAEETSRKLSQLNLVEGEIEQCNTRIGEISLRLDSINADIATLNDSISALDTHLRQITATYVKAIKRSQGRRQQMSALAFIFSSDSFAQAYRRLRYLRQFAKWREKRAAEISAAREALEGKRHRLTSLADHAAKSKNQLSGERASLVKKQTETANLVDELRSQGGTLKEIMAEQRARANALDRELDNVIAREAAKREAARKAAEAEKARKAAEAEAARKAAEEEAARKAAAEEAARKAREAAEAEAAEAVQASYYNAGSGSSYAPAAYYANGSGLTRSSGVNNYNGRRETYYSSNVLYHHRTGEWTQDSEGFWRDSDGYYVVAAGDKAQGSTFTGSKGECKVYDSGCAAGTTDYLSLIHI